MWHLQAQAGMECEKTDLQVVMEDKKLQMDGGCRSGQFGCRKEEGSTETEVKMEKAGWTEGKEAPDEYEPMEDKDRCVLGTMVEGPDQAFGPLTMECHHSLPSSLLALPTGSH